ncbi:uncharacterized protein LOC125645670 isoform X26 [Ostrea edulis]|uniref:uncharacterized protein LOC125645670 isoform X26 n=1 Tax=Ostrea edulis TaxID=37623 RepID=UPI0024AF30F6|nr:uncharacterized protein LOC125645670 isoform X26 [Ostrea edulis]
MALKLDVNNGPFTLTHDPRPRDLKTSNNTSTDNPLYQDFRFKGYPSEGFNNPHNPQYKRNSAADMNGSDVNRYFGKTQHFDSARKTELVAPKPQASEIVTYHPGDARPKLDEGHRSIQYGSGDPRIDESQQVRPSPMKGFDNRNESERDRLRREMIETEQDRQRLRYQDEMRMRDRVEERKRDMEMLKNYNPWGRPGGGAPMDRPGYNPSGPRDSTRLDQISRDPANMGSPKNNSPHEPKNEQGEIVPSPPAACSGSIVDRLGTPGGGAPLKTGSGNHMKTRMNSAKIIRFQNGSKWEVENIMRYDKDSLAKEEYSKDLNMQQKQETLRNQEEKLQNLKQELNHLKAATTDRRPDSFQERRQFDEYDPWGKGIGNPLRNTDGYLMNIRKSFRSRKNGFGDSYDRGGNPRTAPETNRSATNPFEEFDNLGKIGKPRKPNMELHPIYHPFGKSGGGAPVKDTTGRVNTVLHGHSDRHYLRNNLTDYERRQNAIKAKIYYAELGEQLEHQQYKKQMEIEEKKRPHGELAVIIDDKLTGKPRRDPITGALKNHHLGNSDVSLQKMGSQPRNFVEQRQYHDYLDVMNEERFRRNALGKMKDFQEGKKHYDTMDGIWGRPGGGAPKGYTMRKFNLNDIIHRPTKDKAPVAGEYMKNHDWSEVNPDKFFSKDDDEYYATQRSPRQNPMLSARDIQEGRLSPGSIPKKYIKSTVTSTHANMYDYKEDYPQKDYKVGAPYATVNHG